MTQASSVCIVCMANYCRSPVAEQLLQRRFMQKKITSAGINPFYDGDMDRRSKEFLHSKDLKSKLHVPKKINLDIIKNFDIILAMDVMVLMALNKLFPKYMEKFKVYNFQNTSLSLRDPYQLRDDEYIEVMENIYKIAIELEI